LLAIVLGNANRFEALWILVPAETSRKSREPVATVSTFSFDFFADLAPGGDHGPRVATFIDVLLQVLWRKSMIGQSRLTPLRWLPPPARGLAPASVVVTERVSRTAASRSAVSLAPALTHALLPDGGRRVVLIQLDPNPLCIKERLTHLRIMAALEDGRYPGDVGHRSPETPLAYSGKLRVELAMHRLWQNCLNYTGSNTQVLSQGLQRTSNGVTHWSVRSPPDTTVAEPTRIIPAQVRESISEGSNVLETV
jgi:hypothetical protein